MVNFLKVVYLQDNKMIITKHRLIVAIVVVNTRMNMTLLREIDSSVLAAVRNWEVQSMYKQAERRK